ncbi:MAG: hypothetical protein WDN47_02305 [Candidatus Doudnabacteria bacterium]
MDESPKLTVSVVYKRDRKRQIVTITCEGQMILTDDPATSTVSDLDKVLQSIKDNKPASRKRIILDLRALTPFPPDKRAFDHLSDQLRDLMQALPKKLTVLIVCSEEETPPATPVRVH